MLECTIGRDSNILLHYLIFIDIICIFFFTAILLENNRHPEARHRELRVGGVVPTPATRSPDLCEAAAGGVARVSQPANEDRLPGHVPRLLPATGSRLPEVLREPVRQISQSRVFQLSDGHLDGQCQTQSLMCAASVYMVGGVYVCFLSF